MTEDPNPLSKREQEILELVARGLTNQEIARDLVITLNTVKVHLRNIFAKLEANSRTEAIVKAAQAGWIHVAGMEGVDEMAEIAPALPPEPGLASWQRVYFFAAAVLVLAILLLPGVLSRLEARPTANDLSDAGRQRLGAPQRVEASRWTSLAPLPEPRSRLALVAFDDRLAAIGGEGPAGVSGATFLYDTEANGWLSGSDKPTPVSNVQAGVMDGLVYVPGGVTVDGVASRVLEVYDLAGDAWTARSALPAPLSGYALAVFDQQLYLFGGWDGTDYVDSVWVYDPAADGWSSRSPMPNTVGFAAAAALPDRILVAGGFDGGQEYAACSAYYPTEDRWEACAPMNLPRGGLGMAADGASAYAIGGGWQRAATFNERYDSLTNTWSSIPSPVQGQWLLPGVAGRGSLIYAVGGWSGDFLDNSEVF
ncbi:MAG TPA: LuxR C-terminal-related transcriptional regulator, partial [Anaerolineae bacterium]|nr:LuxR C-terminal-related transcriptional regulator [Anaerolineae bacterium]